MTRIVIFRFIRILFALERERERGGHENALNAEMVGINCFYMDIGLDNYRVSTNL